MYVINFLHCVPHFIFYLLIRDSYFKIVFSYWSSYSNFILISSSLELFLGSEEYKFSFLQLRWWFFNFLNISSIYRRGTCVSYEEMEVIYIYIHIYMCMCVFTFKKNKLFVWFSAIFKCYEFEEIDIPLNSWGCDSRHINFLDVTLRTKRKNKL